MNRKVFFGFLGIFFFVVTEICSGEEFSISFSPCIEMENGGFNEFVWTYLFDDEGERKPGSDYKLSELNWEISNYFLYGEKLNLTFGRFGIDTKVLVGGETPSGTMMDSDWQNTAFLDRKTNLSISENTLKSAFSFDLKLSYSFLNNDFIRLKPFFSLNYYNYFFEARNAEGWYGNLGRDSKNYVSWDDPAAHHYYPGELCGIDYFRKTFNVYFGVTPSFYLFDILYIDINASVPVFTNVNSLDTHYNNRDSTSGYCYNDRFNCWFTGFNFEADGEIRITRIMKIGGSYNYYYLKELSGTTFTRVYKSNFYTQDKFSYPKCSGQKSSFGFYFTLQY